MVRIVMFFLIVQLAGAIANAQTTFLDRFRNSQFSAMDEVPAKYGDIQDPAFLKAKAGACRQSRSRFDILREGFNLGAPPIPASEGSIENFLENSDIKKNINELDGFYQKAAVDVQPWSGDYWAIATGAAAKRYNDPEFQNISGWQAGFEYFLNTPSSILPQKYLSPAEKYDLVASDENYSLSRASWLEGKKYFDQFGKVEAWMGLCHGWAPASFMTKRPTKTVSMASLNGNVTVEFRPDDLKALLTLKWANGANVTPDLSKSGTRFLGGRCNVKNPNRDEKTGRIIDQTCFDLNPATWHIAVTNQIAGERRPLIIDASFDYEVWNHPVTAYRYRYFNPKTLKSVRTLAEATVSLDDPTFKDPFKSFRNNRSAVSLVGIIMNVTYTVESTPTARAVDSKANDLSVTTGYHYDLELDYKGEIIGGEWYQNRHPDFIWMPIRNSIAINREDLFVKDKSDALRVAPSASSKSIPLKYVLDQLQLE